MIHARFHPFWSNQDYSQNYPQDLGFHHEGTERADELEHHFKKKRERKKIGLRKKWQPTPAFLPGEIHG